MTNILEAIKIPKKFLMLTGQWPEKSRSFLHKVKSNILFGLDALFALSLLVEIFNNFDDYEVLSEHLSLAISPTSYFVKSLIFKLQLVHVQELMSQLELREFNDYPKHLSAVVEKTVKLSRFVGNAYQLSCFVVVFIYDISPLVTKQKLLARFSYDIGGFQPAMYVFQVLGLASAALNNTCLDILAMGLMGICAAQIEILNKKIIGLSHKDKNGVPSTENINLSLKKCVKHHVQIIR
ncbi:hypothetical protein JTB14_005359 [Gonioctena quinquepunctata]|nr:hypothetical protein JTB14_005359 [Gonioctena quinquepunctata]